MAFGQNEKSYVLFGIDVLVSPNAIAFFCSLSVFLSLLYIIKEKKFKYFFVMCFLVIGLMLTGSRKGLLLLVAGVIFILFTIYTKQRFESLLLSLLALGIVYLLTMNIPFLYNIIGERTQALIVSIFSDGPVSEASIQTRKLLRQEAFSYFKRRPMLGYGIDTFRQMNKWHIITDNNYLELLVSGGIVGLIIYYSWLPSALINNYRLKEKTAYYKILFFVMIFMFVLEYGQVTFLSRGSTLIYPFVFSYFSLCNKKYSKYGWRKKDDF